MFYILPGGSKLDLRGMCMALTEENIFNRHFLDTATGRVKLVSVEFDSSPDDIIKKIQQCGKYVEIHAMTTIEKRAWMERFTAEIIEDEKLRSKIKKNIEMHESFRDFERELAFDKSGWIHGWVQYKWSSVNERVAEWLAENGIDAEEKWEYDEDCPICRMMKEAQEKGEELFLEDFLGAFEEAKEEGYSAGGFPDDLDHDNGNGREDKL